jgi:hypothetical protein
VVSETTQNRPKLGDHPGQKVVVSHSFTQGKYVPDDEDEKDEAQELKLS